MADRSPTLAELAAELRLNKSTVSRALRNDPKVRATTRDRVQALAQSRGYQPNPVLAALGQRRWQRTAREPTLNWAFLCDHAAERTREYEPCRMAAARIGYALTPVGLGELGSAKAVNQILEARGVTGVLLNRILSQPIADDFDWENLAWSKFAWVSVGECHYAPSVHAVLFNMFADSCQALERIRQHGYRRVAFIREASVLSRLNLLQAAAARLIGSQWNDAQLADFEVTSDTPPIEAIEAFDPDALLLGYTGLHWRLSASLSARPWASLMLFGDEPGFAGMRHDLEDLCQAAVDLLDLQYRQRTYGQPVSRHQLQIDSVWVNGESLPSVVRT